MKPADHVRANLTDDGLVVLDIKQGQIFTANVIAARIWQGILVDGHSRNDVVDSIAKECNTPPDVVSNDVDEFIARLQQQQLIVA